MTAILFTSLADPTQTVAIETDNVVSLVGFGAGTRITVERSASDLTDGPYLDVTGTAAAAAAAITAAGGQLAAFTPFGGAGLLAVNPHKVAALEPIGGGLGTRISTSQGASENTGGPFAEVTGAVAATIATLAAAGVTQGVLAYGSIDGATGALNPGSFGVAGSVRNALGDYTITFSATLPASGFGLALTPTSPGEATINGAPVGATQNIATFNSAGAAADLTFFFLLVGPT